MGIPITSTPTFVAELDSVVSRLEDVERRARALDAERMKLMAAAFDIAVLHNDEEDTDDYTFIPEGRTGEIAYRSIRAEIATSMRLSETTIDRKLSHAHTLTLHYPRVLDSLARGLINERHVSTILDAAEVIGFSADPEHEARRASYETAVLKVAEGENPNRLRPIAKQLAEQYALAPLDERHERAREDRRVFLIERGHGMSDLIAHLPTAEAQAVFSRLTNAAKELNRIERAQQAEQEKAEPAEAAEATFTPRTRDQARADLFLELLTYDFGDEGANVRAPAGTDSVSRGVSAAGGVSTTGLRVATDPAADTATGTKPHSGTTPDLDRYGLRRVTGQVQIIVTDETLFATEQTLPWARFGEPSALAPPELVGAGPISPDEAKRIAYDADFWDLIRHNTDTGEVISVDRYRPSAHMRRLLGARDVHCRFPGCRAPVYRCDLDHTIAAEHGGPTATNNLGYLCRGHHTLKHHGGWGVEQDDHGTLTWTSPTGRSYEDRPPSKVRFEHATKPTTRARPNLADEFAEAFPWMFGDTFDGTYTDETEENESEEHRERTPY